VKKAAVWVGLAFLLLGCTLLSQLGSDLPATPTSPPLPAAATLPPPTPAFDPASAPTGDLSARLLAGFPAETYGGIQVIPLTALSGSPPLWAAFSTGLRSFEGSVLPSHFVSLYTYTGSLWQEITRLDLDSPPLAQGPGPGIGGGGPDYLDPSGLRQVLVEPGHLWLEVEGGVGAHGGVYELLLYDGSQLVLQAWNSNSSPGAGSLKDLNADGIQEVLLNTGDPYVFAYAAGVRKLDFVFLRWDSAQQRMVEVPLAPLPEDAPQPAREPANQAVAFAQAGLWKDAKALIDQARQAAGQAANLDTLAWDGILIDYYAAAMAADSIQSPFPLIAHVFYGDYGAAVDLLRAYPPEQIFSPQPAILIDSPAVGFEQSLAGQIITSAGAALQQKPDLAGAYFLRAWAAYLIDPANPQIRADVARAAELDPQDGLYGQCAAYLE